MATWKHDRCRGVHAFHAAPRRGVSSWTLHPCRGRRTGEAAHPTPPTTAADVTQRRECEHHGRRIGEADHPGPDSEGEPATTRIACTRSNATVAAWSRPAALRDHQAETDAAETLSDTLSSTTPFASPRGDAPQRPSGAMAQVAPEEATPGLMPPPSPERPPRMPSADAEPLRWQDARPPSSLPGERNSWLYIPLLHAGTGTLTSHAYQSCTRTGIRILGSALAFVNSWPCCGMRTQFRRRGSPYPPCPTPRCPYRPRYCFAWPQMDISQRQRKQHF